MKFKHPRQHVEAVYSKKHNHRVTGLLDTVCDKPLIWVAIFVFLFPLLFFPFPFSFAKSLFLMILILKIKSSTISQNNLPSIPSFFNQYQNWLTLTKEYTRGDLIFFKNYLYFIWVIDHRNLIYNLSFSWYIIGGIGK